MSAHSLHPAAKAIGLLFAAAYCGGMAYYFIGVRGVGGVFIGDDLNSTIYGLILVSCLLGFFAIVTAIRGWAHRGQPETSSGYGQIVILLVVAVLNSLYFLRSSSHIERAEGGVPSTEGLGPILLGFVAAGAVVLVLVWWRAAQSKLGAASRAKSFEPNVEGGNPDADAIIARYLASAAKDRAASVRTPKTDPDTPRGTPSFGRRR